MKGSSEPAGIETSYQGSGHRQSESNGLDREIPGELTVAKSGRVCKPVTKLDM